MKTEKEFPILIGLEIHCYLNTEEKLFCMCKTKTEGIDSRDERANTRICPICTGTPGSKPMLPNAEAVKKLIQLALVLDCKITHNKPLIWNRKHYNWADLPKGYQNTISGAHAVLPAYEGRFNGIGITEVHLEEDPAQWNPETGNINYNRSGLPLVEIVTEPQFFDAEQVVEWLKELILSLSYIKAIRKNAGIKVDVNISTYGERVEMKNLNSIEKIRKAIEYEVSRQLEAYSNGIVQKRETLAFDERLGKTVKMREKEGQADYRFIPEPDLPFLLIDEKEINAIKRSLPEMPSEKLDKLVKKFKIDSKSANILARNLELVEFVESLAEKLDVAKNISWITIELLRVLNYNKKTLEDEDVLIEPEHLAELISAVEKGKITVLKGKQIMNDFVPKSFSLKSSKNEVESIDEKAVENLCKQVIDENINVVDEFKEGKKEALNWLIGAVMKLSNRRADYKTVSSCLLRLLK